MKYEMFLERLRNERKRKGISLQGMEKATGLRVAQLSYAERGKGPLRMRDYFAICGVLEISPKEMMPGNASDEECFTLLEKIKELSKRDFRIVSDLVLILSYRTEDL